MVVDKHNGQFSMKIPLSILVLLLLSLLALGQDSGDKTATKTFGNSLKSPDGIFTVAVGVDADETTLGLIITNIKTGKQYPFYDVLPSILSVKWTLDSKSIVIISHIRGGSIASIAHLSNDKWDDYTPEPWIGDYYGVVREIIHDHTVEITYRVHEKPQGDSDGHYYTCSFIVNTNTHTRSKETVKEIDSDAYERLNLVEDKN